jgi:hypothetical protein
MYNILIFAKAYNKATVKKYEEDALFLIATIKKLNHNTFYFSHCMVVGDRQKHLACLLTVKAVMDPATLEVTTHQGFGSGFNQVSGSGSVFGIRIRIQEGKNDPQK